MDHPRSRGVYAWAAITEAFRGGSSPLARGLPGVTVDSVSHRRIIPARAGFTSSRSSDSPTRTGSSPLARGLQPSVGHQIIDRGIIPARAGFTTRWRHRSSEATDHPRSRGVYSTMTSIPFIRGGSSPLARGLPWHTDSTPRTARIIPARAGFTAATTLSSPPPKDHPRSRGVYAPTAG